ncbi:MAG: hypothetical protein J6K91_05810 [Opitutales bacterium]|nr:hypothetical protein [Opitutales bacterium]
MAGDLIPPHTYTSGDLLTAASLNDFLLEAKIKDEVVKFSHFTKEALEDLEDFFNKRRYKIGDLFITKNEENPCKIYGGTWELIKDKFLLGAGGEYTLGSIGGEAEHKLSIEEMPSHNHYLTPKIGNNDWIGNRNGNTKLGWLNAGNEVTTTYTGGGEPHNNMPPYIAVNIWIKVSDENDSSVS